MDCIDFMDTKGGALQGGLGDGFGSGGRGGAPMLRGVGFGALEEVEAGGGEGFAPV
jgi:hypothetical protein